MTYDTEHFYAVQTFLEDDELHKIWNIIEIAMNREGYDVSNSELSLRLYDQELESNIEYDSWITVTWSVDFYNLPIIIVV